MKSVASIADVAVTRSACDTYGSHVSDETVSSSRVPDIIHDTSSLQLSAVDKMKEQNSVNSGKCVVNRQSTQNVNGTQRFKSRPQLFEAIQQNSTATNNGQIQETQVRHVGHWWTGTISE